MEQRLSSMRITTSSSSLGSFDIVVNDRKVARRFPNDHMGEMAGVLAMQLRSATVIFAEDSVICKLTVAMRDGNQLKRQIACHQFC
jgi:hypothetical protein